MTKILDAQYRIQTAVSRGLRGLIGQGGGVSLIDQDSIGELFGMAGQRSGGEGDGLES
jgi:hypothetical protein